MEHWPPDPDRPVVSVTVEQTTAREKIRRALGRLHRAYGDLIRLPALRAELSDVAREIFNAELRTLERQRVIALCIAQSPALLPADERADGIWQEGRGLLFYVVPCESSEEP